MVGANSLIGKSQLVLVSMAIGECSRVSLKSYMKQLLNLVVSQCGLQRCMSIYHAQNANKHQTSKLCCVNIICGKIFATATSTL